MTQPDSSFLHALGRLIANHRKKSNMTQAEMATAMGVSESQIKTLEQGNRGGDFGFAMIDSLAKLQGRTIPEVVETLVIEAGSTPGMSSDRLFDGLLPMLSDSSRAVLENGASRSSERFGNYLTWALEVSSVLLELEDREKIETEIRLRRLSPRVESKEFRERLKQLYGYF